MKRKRTESRRGINKSIYIPAEDMKFYEKLEDEATEKKVGVGALICDKLRGLENEK